jgi:prepilin-type processing-associated H-X9-DG protein
MRSGAQGALCVGRARDITASVLLWAGEHDGEFPRSSHSAFGHAQRGWTREIMPYAGGSLNEPVATIQKRLRCPSDRRRTGWSYGLNVYFELDPDADDYEGSPATWRRLASVPHPASTLLLCEVNSNADHVMPQFWEGGGGSDVEQRRHGARSVYAFVDGHAEVLSFRDTYHPATHRDRWNPARAGGH